ncbi:MAG: hypothetical protein VX278_09800 [Myxococcota bacterium]|nr:hypothetical protein [Myxococcota bacterium]
MSIKTVVPSLPGGDYRVEERKKECVMGWVLGLVMACTNTEKDESSEDSFLGYATCTASCTVASDCGTSLAYMDADNHICQDNACVYMGCNDDSECADLGDYVCAGTGGNKACLQTCTTPTDCGTGYLYMDEDNYLCENGACVYQGCNDDAECAELGYYTCYAGEGYTVPACLESCERELDCSMGASYADEDNYTCQDGACLYSGCNDDSECADLGDFICYQP